jgi:hypothetical protein
MANCENCQCDLGVEVKELPVHVEEEVWCPQCFVWKRAAMEPERFMGDLKAVHCMRCGMVSVDFGRGACGQCGASIAISLPPKHLPERLVETH